jgi:hypothetical protein
MITAIICVICLVVLYRNREEAGCWIFGVGVLLFLLLAAGAMTPLDTLRRMDGGIQSFNRRLERQQFDSAQRRWNGVRP